MAHVKIVGFGNDINGFCFTTAQAPIFFSI